MPVVQSLTAVRADNADIAEGDVLQLDLASAYINAVKQPVTTGLKTNFAGVAIKAVENDQGSNNALAVIGPVRAKVLCDSTNGSKGAYLVPTNAQDYFTRSATETPIILLTDMTAGDHTNAVAYGPADGSLAPWVWIGYPGGDWA